MQLRQTPLWDARGKNWEEENRGRWLITIQTQRLWGGRGEQPGCNSDNPNEQRQECTQFMRGLLDLSRHANISIYVAKRCSNSYNSAYFNGLKSFTSPIFPRVCWQNVSLSQPAPLWQNRPGHSDSVGSLKRPLSPLLRCALPAKQTLWVSCLLERAGKDFSLWPGKYVQKLGPESSNLAQQQQKRYSVNILIITSKIHCVFISCLRWSPLTEGSLLEDHSRFVVLALVAQKQMNFKSSRWKSDYFFPVECHVGPPPPLLTPSSPSSLHQWLSAEKLPVHMS